MNEVLSADKLVQRTDELATTIATRSPNALRLFKPAIDDGLEQPLASALRLERLVTAEHLHSGDVEEGLKAFAESVRRDSRRPREAPDDGPASGRWPVSPSWRTTWSGPRVVATPATP